MTQLRKPPLLVPAEQLAIATQCSAVCGSPRSEQSRLNLMPVTALSFNLQKLQMAQSPMLFAIKLLPALVKQSA